jgi:hypothetical protein
MRRASFALHRRSRGVLFALACAALLVASCGRSRLTVVSIEAGGAGGHGDGGAPANAGAAGESALPAPSEVEACLHFVRSVCSKLFFECNAAPDDPHPCPPSIDATCPDRYFLPGSNTDVPALLACAEAWQAMSCDDLRQGLRPECIPRGELGEEEACVFGAQCSSGFCAAPTLAEGLPGCGTCRRVVGLGEACDGEPVRCADGLECHGTCDPSPPFGLAPGAACERLGQCQSGFFCLTLAGAEESTCQPAPEPGDDCAIDTPYCEGNCDDDGVCRPAPATGEPCALSANDAHICDQGLRCDFEAGEVPRCTAPLALGETCRPLNADFSSGGCESGTLCHCIDAACEAGTCVRRRDLFASCDGEHDVCLGGTSCREGRCEPSGSQARFALACGG